MISSHPYFRKETIMEQEFDETIFTESPFNETMLLGNIVFNEDSIYDILNATIDPDLMKEVADSMLEFNGSNNIILYTSLNKTNTDLLRQGKYDKPIKAFEYYEASLALEQSEYIIKLAYDTKDLYDTLHPRACREIESLIKQHKLKKSEIEDMQIIRHLLKSYTGVRVHSINPAKKCYAKTHILFEDSKVAYILKPQAITVLGTISKQQTQTNGRD